jgi:hypothetical protein
MNAVIGSSEAVQGSTDLPLLINAIMADLRSHLDYEFKEQRIRGTDYSKVFLASMEFAMSNSTQYLVGMALASAQKAKIAAEIAVLELEKEKLRFQIDYVLPMELKKLENESLLLELEREKLRYQIDYIFPLEVKKLEFEAERLRLEGQRVLNEANEIAARIPLTNAQTRQILETLPYTIEKTAAEANLVRAKYMSELVQPDINRKQVELLEQQRRGFIRNAEQQAAKIIVDTWSVSKSVDEDYPVPDGLQADEIASIVHRMLWGVFNA